MPISLRSAVVLGSTGLVGGCLLRMLAARPGLERVVAIGRRPSGAASSRVARVTEVVADLGVPATYRDHLDVDCVFCALGTTIKKAGSEAAFRQVDYEYPLAVARAAVERGARRYVIVTAVGADPKSRIFYNRVKGELEESLKELHFAGGLRVLHPSILLGDRAEARPGEGVAASVMKATAGLFVFGLAKYRAISAEEVARAMMAAATADGKGTVVYEGKSLFDLAV
jgi:uncharacterized protein YbjT (DUF2867 family)